MSESTNAHIDRVLRKLSEARKRKLSCFGSDSHRFELRAPLTEAEVTAFEAEHGIALPEDFRAFLIHAGNGGAGPYYGIYPLKEWSDFAGWAMDSVPDGFLARPNAFRPGENPNPSREADANLAAAYQGTLSIGTQGCTYCMQLITAGPFRGRVVYVDADGYKPPYVVRDADFLGWYERWLDELLAGYETSWFGYSPPGGEEEFFALVEGVESDDALRGEAARAFLRLPRLSERGGKRLLPLLEHASAAVRAGACAAAGKFSIVNSGERLLALLHDGDSDVRRNAVEALMRVTPKQHADAVRAVMLNDSDQDVARIALHQLELAKLLSRDDLVRVLRAPNIDGLHASAAAKLKWTAQDADLAVTLVDAADPQVRMAAIRALGELKAASAVPALVTRLSLEETASNIEHILRALGDIGVRSASDTLLAWTQSRDDFHRLEALQALIKLADDRALPIARAMLQEDRKPVRNDGLSTMSSVYSIRELVQRMLRTSDHWRFLCLGWLRI